MKSRKNTIKCGGAGIATDLQDYGIFESSKQIRAAQHTTYANADAVSTTFDVAPLGNNRRGSFLVSLNKGGSKHKSRKSRKTKKSNKTNTGCGAHQGGKKKCPKHCRRKTSRTRKGLKRRKN